MIDKLKVINFIQDFGCAKLSHLQILFEAPGDNFKSVLNGNMVSRKDDIFVHNTAKIDENMLIALDILCKYKKRLVRYYKGYEPTYIKFLTNENLLYNIIVATEENRKGIVKFINSYPAVSKVDKLILAFPNEQDLENIDCEIPFLYTSYPELKVLNKKHTEETDEEIDENA